MIFRSWSFCFSPPRNTFGKNLRGPSSAAGSRLLSLADGSGRNWPRAEDLLLSLFPAALFPYSSVQPCLGQSPDAPSPGQALRGRSAGLALFLLLSPKDARVGFWVSTSALQTQTLPPQEGCLEAMLGKGRKRMDIRDTNCVKWRPVF